MRFNAQARHMFGGFPIRGLYLVLPCAARAMDAASADNLANSIISQLCRSIMMFRGLLVSAFVLSMGTAGFAQNATLNQHRDDGGPVYLNGVQLTIPKQVGNPALDTTAMPVTLVDQNCLAIKVLNGAWGGGMCASINLNDVGINDTMRSDSTWHCTDVPQANNDWTQTSFNDASWKTAGDYGLMADDTGGNPKPQFTGLGLAAANLFYQRARWIWTPMTCYFRKSFTSTGGTATAMIRGCNVTWVLYVNGNAVDARTVSNDNLTQTIVMVNNVPLINGQNAIALRAVDNQNGNGVLMKVGIRNTSGVNQLSNTTWKSSWDGPTGWNTAGFDDASWTNTGAPTAYEPNTDGLNAASWIWPTDVYFRKVFGGSTGVAAPTASRNLAGGRVLRTEYYSLRGERLSAAQVGMLKSSSMVIERQFISNGSSVSRTIGVGK
jgi:hypothetical protein